MNGSSVKRLLKSFGYAMAGIRNALVERNMRIHLLAAVLVFAAGFLLDIDRQEWCLVVLCIGAVISAEMFNTAIERLCDHVCNCAYDKTIGIVKDIAAGAVLITALVAAIVGLVIFIPRLLNLIL